MRFLSILGATFLAVTRVAAQAIPFTIDGPLENVSPPGPNFNSGGTVTVAGTTITMPDNILIQFPATFVSFKDFAADFAANGGSYGGWEVHVDGNYVAGKPIAGRFFISQLIGGAGAGIVESVAFDGTLKIANGGPTLRVNTPNGVYAKAFTSRLFLTADEENPSISSFSGYPMCIPQSATDADCPSNNRPANGARVYTPTNTSAMAPFVAGDYVTWAGIKNGAEVLVYTLVAETVQQLTDASKGDPLYLRVEDVNIAINDGTLNVEVGTTRFTGYLSDGSGSVSVYRLDIDPCTGTETEVQVAAGGLKAGDARNKFDIRFSDGSRTVASKEYRVKANKGQKTVTKGFKTGQFVAPISEVIWPENNVPGTPWSENAFDIFTNLKDGFVFNNQQWGQLTPWPGAKAPTAAKKCVGNELTNTPTNPPAGATAQAKAGADITGQTFGSITTLNGQFTSAGLTAADVTFKWTTDATGITIQNADKATATFVNPWGTASVSRTFTLEVCTKATTPACTTDAVVVTTDKTTDTIKITSYKFANQGGGTITVTAESNNVLPANPDGAKLSITFGATTAAMNQDATNGGVYTFSRTGVGKQPTSITIKSAHSGSATTNALIKRRFRAMRFMRN
ncbi:hypothetical protein BCR34DRAFT_591069 [Clohesyomyces aquaticus]|uniref:Uncharacterized protein n=1 Tax=Clohesyomyces aquaticus TaxID=1231657 RepID=A0A1Y1Z3U0_9PLEO|nr:hypothetical protein BCR34DRAFT_591069 [Clohesyomyces aquaticus]